MLNLFSLVLFYRSLICRPLPIDIGRCTCVIVKEPMPQGLSNGTFFSLYTYVCIVLYVLLYPYILIHYHSFTYYYYYYCRKVRDDRIGNWLWPTTSAALPALTSPLLRTSKDYSPILMILSSGQSPLTSPAQNTTFGIRYY
jgi:hypothetical protein